MSIIELPIIINGKFIPRSDAGCYEFPAGDSTIRLPKLQDEHYEQLRLIPATALRDVPSQEIIEFFHRVSSLWRDDHYSRRAELLKLGPLMTGESEAVYLHSLKLVIGLIATRAFMGDIIDCELGNRMLLDEWVPKQNVLLRAEPLGKLFHVMVGNVPIAGIYSLVRGILCKNVNLAKLPARDIITLLLFISSFRDVAPDHPVTKTTSVFYYGREDEIWSERFVDLADGVCVWGGSESTAYYKKLVGTGVDIIEYGPKRGIQILCWDSSSAQDLPSRCAHDICVFDQEACFCPQTVYVIGDVDDFVKRLEAALTVRSRVWPRAQYEPDHFAHLQIAARCHMFGEDDVSFPSDLSWMIVKTTLEKKTSLDHPLGRTVYVVPIHDTRECLDAIDVQVQTVGVEPLSLAWDIKDDLAKRGVQRIANVGYVEVPRLGLGHYGKNLDRLIRWVALERSRSYNSRIYDMTYDEAIHNFDSI